MNCIIFVINAKTNFDDPENTTLRKMKEIQQRLPRNAFNLSDFFFFYQYNHYLSIATNTCIQFRTILRLKVAIFFFIFLNLPCLCTGYFYLMSESTFSNLIELDPVPYSIS